MLPERRIGLLAAAYGLSRTMVREAVAHPAGCGPSGSRQRTGTPPVLSGLVLLFGAGVAFYVQHPEYLYLRCGEPRLGNRMRERLALSAMELVARRYIHGDAAPSQQDFTRYLQVPRHVLMVVLDARERRGLVVASAQEPCTYLPARDPGRIPVAEVLETVRAWQRRKAPCAGTTAGPC